MSLYRLILGIFALLSLNCTQTNHDMKDKTLKILPDHEKQELTENQPNKLFDCIKNVSKLSEQDIEKLLNPDLNFEDSLETSLLNRAGQGDFGVGYVFKGLFIKKIHAIHLSSEENFMRITRMIQKEQDMSSLLNSKHFVKICGTIEKTGTHKELLMLSQAIPGKMLSRLVPDMTIHRLHKILDQTCDIASLATEKKVLLDDIHEDNVIIDDEENLRVVDLGELEMDTESEMKALYLKNIENVLLLRFAVSDRFLPMYEMGPALLEFLQKSLHSEKDSSLLAVGTQQCKAFYKKAFEGIPDKIINNGEDHATMLKNMNKMSTMKVDL